jgi:hypothetical protein
LGKDQEPAACSDDEGDRAALHALQFSTQWLLCALFRSESENRRS